MFERDKAELRDLGIPLETGRNSIFDAEDGYRITRRKYELPPVTFDPAEAAAVGLAARLWQSATLGAPARNALIKLRAGGTDVAAGDAPGAQPHVDASDPALPPLLDAARHARVATFDYLKTGTDSPERRTVQPWGVLSWRRRWYVVGHDLDRGEARSFRLSRVVGDVDLVSPPGAFQRPDVDLLAFVASRGPDSAGVARIAVSGPGLGELRRVAEGEADGVLTIRYTDLGRMARIVASAGRSARVLGPPELVDAVVGRLAPTARAAHRVGAGGAAR
jgi:proteasome accessory factor B